MEQLVGGLMADQDRLTSLLIAHRPELIRFVERNASFRLLRYETAEDLVQGIHYAALKAGENFEYRGEKEFYAWIYQIARRQLYDRTAHWYALKRNAGSVLRIAQQETGAFESRAGVDPAADATSPSSYVGRKEQVVLVTRAMHSLLERDRNIVQWSSEGRSIQEIADELGISYDACQQARLRALERLRKAYHLLFQRSTQLGG